MHRDVQPSDSHKTKLVKKMQSQRALSFCSIAKTSPTEPGSVTHHSRQDISPPFGFDDELVEQIENTENIEIVQNCGKGSYRRAVENDRRTPGTHTGLCKGRSGGSVEEWSSEPIIRATDTLPESTNLPFDDNIPSWIPSEERCYWTNSTSFPGGAQNQASNARSKTVLCDNEAKKRLGKFFDGGRRALKTFFHPHGPETGHRKSSASFATSARVSRRCFPVWRNGWAHRRHQHAKFQMEKDRMCAKRSAHLAFLCSRQLSITRHKSGEKVEVGNSQLKAQAGIREEHVARNCEGQCGVQEANERYVKRRGVDGEATQLFELDQRLNSSISFVTLAKDVLPELSSLRSSRFESSESRV